MTLGTFCVKGTPHNVARKTYGSAGKELMEFRLGENMRLKTFSTTVMELAELGEPLWISGEVSENQGGPGYEDKYFTNYDAKVAWLAQPEKAKAAPKATPQPQTADNSDIPF